MPALSGLALTAHIGLGFATTTGLNYLLAELVLDNDTRILAQTFNNSSGSNALLQNDAGKLKFIRNVGFGAGVFEWTNSTGSSVVVRGIQLFVNSAASMSGALALTPVMTFAPVSVGNTSVLRVFNLEMTLAVGIGDNVAGLRQAIASGSAKTSLAVSHDLYAYLTVDEARVAIGTAALGNTLFTRTDGRLTYNGTVLEYTPTGGTSRQVSGFDMELSQGTPGTNYVYPPTPTQAYVEPDQTLRITSIFFDLNG